MIYGYFLIDPLDGKRGEYDEQTWWCLPWKGTSTPGGRRLGEWVWVGRVYS